MDFCFLTGLGALLDGEVRLGEVGFLPDTLYVMSIKVAGVVAGTIAEIVLSGCCCFCPLDDCFKSIGLGFGLGFGGGFRDLVSAPGSGEFFPAAGTSVSFEATRGKGVGFGFTAGIFGFSPLSAFSVAGFPRGLGIGRMG